MLAGRKPLPAVGALCLTDLTCLTQITSYRGNFVPLDMSDDSPLYSAPMPKFHTAAHI